MTGDLPQAPTGTVFNIQHYSLHDGPGIRTVVFLKGCPLRCRWCSNPESQHFHPEVGFFPEKCIAPKGCNWCQDVCPKGALTLSEKGSGPAVLDFSKCQNCLQCVEACPAGAVTTYGERKTVEEVLLEVEKETAFYRHGKGGMTLSGGEPLAQPEFALALLKEAKKRHIHTSMETCGCCKKEDLLEAARYLDHIFFDVKHINPTRHREETGGSNRQILENLSALFLEYPDLPKTIRTPVIPGVNDGEEDLKDIRDYLTEVSKVGNTHLAYQYETLPYHRFGVGKYQALGRPYPMEET